MLSNLLKTTGVRSYSCYRSFGTTCCQEGRYGHRLVKLWEQKDYTTKPLQVFRTGGRRPVGANKVPGRKWTAKLGGGLKREFFWVQHQRMSQEDVLHERSFHERVVEIKEDDNRSGYVALVAGPLARRWILATEGMKTGSLIINSAKSTVGGFSGQSGDAYPLKLIPTGTKVCSVENLPGRGAQIARSAGNSCTVLRKSSDAVILQLPSGREISVLPNCVAVIGCVSNVEHDEEIWGSPLKRRDYGLRPRSGKWNRKDGRHGRKINPKKPMIVYDEARALKEKGTLEA